MSFSETYLSTLWTELNGRMSAYEFNSIATTFDCSFSFSLTDRKMILGDLFVYGDLVAAGMKLSVTTDDKLCSIDHPDSIGINLVTLVDDISAIDYNSFIKIKKIDEVFEGVIPVPQPDFDIESTLGSKFKDCSAFDDLFKTESSFLPVQPHHITEGRESAHNAGVTDNVLIDRVWTAIVDYGNIDITTKHLTGDRFQSQVKSSNKIIMEEHFSVIDGEEAIMKAYKSFGFAMIGQFGIDAMKPQFCFDCRNDVHVPFCRFRVNHDPLFVKSDQVVMILKGKRMVNNSLRRYRYNYAIITPDKLIKNVFIGSSYYRDGNYKNISYLRAVFYLLVHTDRGFRSFVDRYISKLKEDVSVDNGQMDKLVVVNWKKDIHKVIISLSD